MTGGGLIIQPSFAEDLIYPAYQDRLLMKSLGVQAGVVESEDFKVSAGTGLQVNVKKGKAFIEQTKAIEESSNIFYNGLYNVLNPIEQNPYNNVEVSAVNPQIAQIILRVYDIGELKIGGSSYARIEWLNGSPNAEATKAHVEEEKSTAYGAANLPQSSFLCAYVIVPKNATKSSEFEIVDARRYSGPKLIPNVYSSSSMAKMGEMFISEGNVTATLPKPFPGSEIGFYNFENNKILTIKTQKGDQIEGDFVSSKEEVNLLVNQHLTLRGASFFVWSIVSGEPKRESVYSEEKSYAKAEAEAGIEASATRPALVSMIQEGAGALTKVGGVQITPISSSTTQTGFVFFLNPKIKWTVAGPVAAVSTILL